MIGRLLRYAGAYPLWFYAALGLGWSYGLTALLAAAHRLPSWRPGLDVLVTAVTVAVTQLLTRALDDVRDLDYDRLHHPRRPLVTGAVRHADLVVLLAVGLAAMLALNAPRGTPALGYAAAAGYLLILLAVDLRWRWPPGDRLLPQLATGLPALLLISGYVYAGFLHRHGLAPTGLGLAVLAAVTVGVLHLEFARRITRAPAPGQRTYVYEIGVSGTVAAALVCAAAATGWALVVTRPWSGGGYGWGWLVLLALGFTATGAWRFLRGATRWPVGPAAFYVLASFATATVAGLLGAA